GVERDFCELVRALIRQRCSDLPVEKIIFSATHIHTGPNYYGKITSLHVAARFLPPDVTFVETGNEIPEDVWQEDRCTPYIADKLCEAICTAWEKRRPASISPSFGRAVIGHCRRAVYDDDSAKMYGSTETVNFRELEGGNDSGIELLYVFSEDTTPVGVLVNVACPSQVVEGKHYVSSDFWGKARDRIKARLGDDFIVLGLCGAGGDQSPRDLVRRSNTRKRLTDPDMHDLPGAVELGGRIASVVLDKLPEAQAEPRNNALIRHAVLTVEFPLRRVTIAERDRARLSFDDYVAGAKKKDFTTGDMGALHIHGGILERFEAQQKEQFYTTEIHVARLGDMAFATNPFELFLDYGNQIKALSEAAQTFVVQLACDWGGYLPTAKAERGSHYSAYIASGKTGQAGGALLVSKTVDTIQKLWQS
ncbi:MAG: hypothetical protein SCM11_05690, partial [Bacillota bacterium]|nr:hypothetical protein [Bacillota bacterium]